MNQIKTTLLLAFMTFLLVVVSQLLGMDLIFAFSIALIFNIFMYFNSDKLAIRYSKAIPIQEGEHDNVVEIVKYLASKEKMPMPKLFIIDSDQPNAFATGRNPKNASVAVTKGILNLLSREELEGVLAHELSHVKNRDILVSTIAVVIGSAISIMSRSYMWGSMFGRGRNRNSHPALLINGMIAAPITAVIIQFAISRTREFGADSTGADITGNPLALASALEKIDAYSKAPLQVNPAVSTLFISDPYKAFRAKEKRGLFSTHPPTAERVRRLREGSSGIRYR